MTAYNFETQTQSLEPLHFFLFRVQYYLKIVFVGL